MRLSNNNKIKSIISICAICICVTLSLCGCDSKAESKSKIQEYDDKLASLNSELEHYQDIYDEALSTYQQYSKYSGSPEWDSELARTKKIMGTAKTKISETERQIILYKKFKQIEEKKLEK